MKVEVTDHAILRYLERVDGPHPVREHGRIDIEAVRARILGDGREEAVAAGAMRIYIDGVQFRCTPCKHRSNVRRIVTVIDKENNTFQKPKKPHASNAGIKPKDGRGKFHRSRR